MTHISQPRKLRTQRGEATCPESSWQDTEPGGPPSVRPCGEARDKALRCSEAPQPPGGEGRENMVSAGGSQKRQQPKHTTDPGQPRLPTQLLVRLPRSQMPLLEKISSWLGTPWSACLPCEGRRGLPSVGRLLSTPERTAGPLKPGREQGREGAGRMQAKYFR